MEQENKQENRFEETMIEGRNAVLEAFRSGKTVDKLFVLDGCQDGPVKTITREAKKQNTIIHYVAKERLDQLSETGKHQGVIAQAAAYRYAEVEDMLKLARRERRAARFSLFWMALRIRTIWVRSSVLPIWQAPHGVIIPKRRAVGLTSTVAKTSAGALNYTPVAKVTNISATIEELKERGLWFVCADMGGESMYRLDLKGPIGLVIGNEAKVSAVWCGKNVISSHRSR